MSIDRRGFVSGALALAGAMSTPALAAKGPRIVSLDYAAAETLLALGVVPSGVQSSDRWDMWVAEPELPRSVVNVGQDLVVNLEVIASLEPDVIITTPYTDTLRDRLERIAPVYKVSVYDSSQAPLSNAYRETLELGRLAGVPEAADSFLKGADRAFADMRHRLAQTDRPPVALVSFMDRRHVRVYGAGGLYQDVMDRLGIANAWTRPANYWGFATIGLEELARATPQDMHLIAFEPIIDEIRPTLASSPIWRSLPVVENGNFAVFPPVLPFGMVPSALRFARLITAYLEGLSA